MTEPHLLRLVESCGSMAYIPAHAHAHSVLWLCLRTNSPVWASEVRSQLVKSTPSNTGFFVTVSTVHSALLVKARDH